MQKQLFAHRHQKTFMQKSYLVLAVLILASASVWGQRLGDYYIPIATRGFVNGRLKFVNDSTVEISNKPTHMSGLVVVTLPYRTSHSAIEIASQRLSPTQRQALLSQGLQQFIKPAITLARTETGFIDYQDSLVYVRAKDFRRTRLLYIIEGKKYSLYLGESDSYGLIQNRGKSNRRLDKRLATVEQNPTAYSIQMLRGLNAYRAVGPEAVFGVVLIKARKQLR